MMLKKNTEKIVFIQTENPKPHIIVEIMQNRPGSVDISAIMHMEHINAGSKSAGITEQWKEGSSSIDTISQIIECNTEIVINGTSFHLQKGQTITIPLSQPYQILPCGKIEMIYTLMEGECD